MIFVLLIFFIYLLNRLSRESISYWFVVLYAVSLCANFLIGTNLGIVSWTDIPYVIWTMIVLSMLIMPWKGYQGITAITCRNPKQVDRFVYIGGALCVFMTVGCFAIAYAVSQVVEDINMFKYLGGQAGVYASLGMDMKPYLLAYIFYPVSYLFIPLMFYYLSQKRYWMTLWCFVSSLASVAHGLAYFSRAHTTQYIMLLVVTYWIFRRVLSEKIRSRVSKFGIVIAVIIAMSFVAISNNRFEDHDYSNQKSGAVIQNTVVYSMADYFGMWYYAGRDVTEGYSFEGFNGRIAGQFLDRFLQMVSFGHYKSYGEQLLKDRERLLKDHSGGFIGVSAYFLYDTGIIFSIIILMIYGRMVRKRTPVNGNVTVVDSLMTTTLVLLPLFGIFYSTLDITIALLFYLIFIRWFLNRN